MFVPLKDHLTFPSTATSWGPEIQTHEPRGNLYTNHIKVIKMSISDHSTVFHQVCCTRNIQDIWLLPQCPACHVSQGMPSSPELHALPTPNPMLHCLATAQLAFDQAYYIRNIQVRPFPLFPIPCQQGLWGTASSSETSTAPSVWLFMTVQLNAAHLRPIKTRTSRLYKLTFPIHSTLGTYRDNQIAKGWNQ